MACPVQHNGTNGASLEKQEEAILNYASYLRLGDGEKPTTGLLSLQSPKTFVSERPCHDEMLFVITHQTFELWFKQILFELDSVRAMFQGPLLCEMNSLTVISRLSRIVTIIKVINGQFSILETMSPLDFQEFRDVLQTASGFQSLQFRLLENKMGLLLKNRSVYNPPESYKSSFDSTSIQSLQKSEEEKSLFDMVDEWLSRTPGSDDEFWESFEVSADEWIEDIFRTPTEKETDPKKKKERQAELDKEVEVFSQILSRDKYEELRAAGHFRFTYDAFRGALFITQYRDEPRFSQPYQIINLLMDVDSWMTKWRYNHMIMAQRMIGSKFGSGGSSGYQYLRTTLTDRYKIYIDLLQLATFVLPRRYLPDLTSIQKKRLRGSFGFAKAEALFKRDNEQCGRDEHHHCCVR